MFQVLEVAIGLVLVFTLVSLGASVLVEWLSGILAMRGKLLWQGIGRMVGKDRERDLCEHPLLQSLTRRTWFDAVFPYLGRAKPSYVPARIFSAALLGVLQGDGDAEEGSDLVSAVGRLPEGHLKRTLQPLVDQAGKDLKQAEANIEHWFDTAMDRVTGWYKRWSQLVLFVLGLGLALWFGIDSIRIGEALWTDDLLREQMVAVAEQMAEDEGCRGVLAGVAAAAGEDRGEEADGAAEGEVGGDAGEAAGGEGDEGGNEGEGAAGEDGEDGAGADAEEATPAEACLERYRDRLAGMKLPLVPFPPGGDDPAGDAASPGGAPASAVLEEGWLRGLPWWSWLLGIGLAAGLFWLDHRHRTPDTSEKSEDQEESAPPLLVRILALAGRIAIVLAVGLTAAALVTGVLERYWAPGVGGWLVGHLPGFLLTAVAVSFGAPFWFDVLGRLVKLRTSGARPQPPTPGQPTAANPSAPAPAP